MADPYGGMVPYRPNRRPAAARAPVPYGGMLPFRPDKLAADLEYEAAAAKKRGGVSAYGPAVMTPQTNTSVRPTVMTPQTSAVMQRLGRRPLNMAQFTAPVGGPKDPDGAQLDQFARANALLEGSDYLASTAGIREPGTYVTPRRRPAGAPNLTYANQAQQPIAPGPYANMRTGGGLRLGGLQDQQSGVAAAIQGGVQAPAAPPAAYRSPSGREYSAEDVLGLADRGRTAAAGIASRSKYGTTAIPQADQRMVTLDDGTEMRVPGLRGSGQGPAMDMEKRQAYLDRVAGDQADRNKLVMAKAQRRTTERMDRIAASKREPTPLEQMAQRNPGLALAMAQMQQRGQLAKDDNALRRELGLGELGLGKERIGSAERIEGTRSTDRRYVADADAKLKADLAARESKDAALAAGATMGLPEAKSALRQRLGGGGAVRSDEGLSLPEIPQEQLGALDEASPTEAKRAMENMGVSQSSISRYLKQRQEEYDTVQQRQALGVNAGSFVNPALMAGNLSARIRGMFDAPPVGLNPEVVARLTPEQRRRLGIPEPQTGSGPMTPNMRARQLLGF